MIVSSTRRVGNEAPIGANALVAPVLGAATAPAVIAAALAFGSAMGGSKGRGE